jgi:hypothetical protein
VKEFSLTNAPRDNAHALTTLRRYWAIAIPLYIAIFTVSTLFVYVAINLKNNVSPYSLYSFKGKNSYHHFILS